MSIIMTPPPLIFLLIVHGVYSADDDWSVTYSSSHICALKNSTVTINCTYKYPTGHHITEVFWTKSNSPDPPKLCNDSKYRERIQYLGDKQHDCSVRLTDVRHTDSHEYYFRFITDKPYGKWIGNPGVTVNVTDLQVESEGETVMEGHSVTLTCKSRCSLTDTSTFIWFRNTQTLNDTNKKLILPSVRRENAGDYRCAVQGHKLTSPPRRLNVIYPPDDPVISISSSGVIVEGDSVTLTCSSESNPPANISWFKEETSVGSGNIFRISNIRSDHSGEFKCKARNKRGHKYSAVTLNVLHPPRNVSASISSSGVIVEGDSVTLTCSSESNPPVHNYSWFKENQTSSVGSGQTSSISNFNSSLSGWFYCVAENELGEKYSESVTLNVLHPPDDPVISISSSGVIVEGDSVTLTCSSESNPPANISWFKEETSVGSGNIFRISNIRSDHSGEYKCKARNKHGHKHSAVTLNVLYPPRNVSASISSSGVIVEGDSVNLTCSSESNPPVHNYSWFKENQTSSVGSGQTFSISNFNSSLSGWFYCVAQNKVGSQRSDDVSLSVKGQASGTLSVVLFAVIICGCPVCVFIVFMRRRNRDDRTSNIGLKKVPRRCSSGAQYDDVQYASVTTKHLRENQTSPESRDPEEVQYATVQHHRNIDMRRSEETENQYDNNTNHQHDAAGRSTVEMMEDKSVIYSSLR
ncbi:sialic acid-binding Ig-like lectin 11 [Triplophysa dalaica]|uniref:sialic acid-binding Ig-like lectin 11 n=1 Tax=Triplophysa dalaica TaxID=1582913 RepID=UPI0024E006EB|nr:sialic acid-binding Ig-like lectin 11 [Triplophysa dalaica]